MTDLRQLALFDELELDAELAWRGYVAGLLDGEGYIGVVRTSGARLSPCVQVAMCEPAAVHELHARYGGSRVSVRRDKSRREGHRPVNQWRVTGAACVRVLSDASPFLLVKGAQARLVADVARRVGPSGRPGHLTAVERNARLRAYYALRELNRRGVRA